VRREFCHVAASPMPGDVVELSEPSQPGEDCEVLLRVLAVVEEFVGFKEYGRGRFWVSLRGWQARLKSARVGKLIRPGDHDLPF
jgi:hypothetical protein